MTAVHHPHCAPHEHVTCIWCGDDICLTGLSHHRALMYKDFKRCPLCKDKAVAEAVTAAQARKAEAHGR